MKKLSPMIMDIKKKYPEHSISWELFRSGLGYPILRIYVKSIKRGDGWIDIKMIYEEDDG